MGLRRARAQDVVDLADSAMPSGKPAGAGLHDVLDLTQDDEAAAAAAPPPTAAVPPAASQPKRKRKSKAAAAHAGEPSDAGAAAEPSPGELHICIMAHARVRPSKLERLRQAIGGDGASGLFLKGFQEFQNEHMFFKPHTSTFIQQLQAPDSVCAENGGNMAAGRTTLIVAHHLSISVTWLKSAPDLRRPKEAKGGEGEADQRVWSHSAVFGQALAEGPGPYDPRAARHVLL